ncbi:MAG: hypothetical protein LC796_15745 [Acidobacteria bacterium]|nr:hypothetical protein [Acidobacteriota bacterium]MCA1610585.1 hypothetical protein [Acidobacteriota bacterium]
MSGDLLPFPLACTGVSTSEARVFADEYFASPPENRERRIEEFRLEHAETLLALCQLLDRRVESGPAEVLEAAKLAYSFISHLPPDRGSFLFDEREYYLGELALIAGCCCRVLSLRQNCREWLDYAAGWFLLTANSAGDSARVSYQRLALCMEERNLVAVLEMAGPILECFNRTGARELALKCRYVQAAAMREAGQTERALEAFEQVCADARELKSTRVLGAVFVALGQMYCEMGKSDQSLRLVVEAEPFLRASGDKVALSKLHWGVGQLLQSQSRIQDALQAYRAAQTELLELKMQGDVAALHLVIADLLLETGQERQAEWEIRAALPIIDELKMVPEGFAAMSLLRESLRRRSIDRGALRKVHGYFEEINS